MKRNLKVLIITCWVVLAICCVLKTVGLNMFAVGTTNENTIAFCTFIDNNFILKVICACISSLILNSLTVLSILQQKFYTKRQMLVFIPLIICISVSSWFNATLSTVLGIIFLLLPILYFPKKWYRCILGFVFVLAFQMLSVFVKDIGGWSLYNTTFLPSILLQIDSFIMVILFYLYSIRKEVT